MNTELVASQQYFEEEDLNTQTYGLQLCTEIKDEVSLDMNHPRKKCVELLCALSPTLDRGSSPEDTDAEQT